MRKKKKWGKNTLICLPRRFPIQINSDESIKDIRNPGGHHRTYVAVDGEGGCYRGEEDVGETQRQADTDVQPHSPLDLARRERSADRGQDKRRHDRGETLMVFDLERLDISDTARLLPFDVGGELRRSHRLAVVDGDQEVRRDDRQRGVLA